jgi:hypothetical protein
MSDYFSPMMLSGILAHVVRRVLANTISDLKQLTPSSHLFSCNECYAQEFEMVWNKRQWTEHGKLRNEYGSPYGTLWRKGQ